jgi:predicted nucleic acid-binding protein
MKTPSSTLVVDPSVLIAAAIGRSAGALLGASRHAMLATTDRAVSEAQRRISLGMKRPSMLPILEKIVHQLNVSPVINLELIISDAEIALRDAVASRNGSTRDAHLLALAWSVDGDIWSGDRDFAGTGVASWTTPNLMRALARAT